MSNSVSNPDTNDQRKAHIYTTASLTSSAMICKKHIRCICKQLATVSRN